jgi:hypothetical protein
VRFTTDKVTLGYLPAYLRIAAELGTAARVCEVGVFGGGSLNMWQALFPAGLVAGVDSNPGSFWPSGTISIVRSQDDPALPELLGQHAPEWDLIVDDASHDGKLSAATFGLLWPLVAPGGFYALEDWMVGLPGGWEDYGTSMADTAAGFLQLLTRDSDVEDITYRYGLAVLRKRSLKGRLNDGARAHLHRGRRHPGDRRRWPDDSHGRHPRGHQPDRHPGDPVRGDRRGDVPGERVPERHPGAGELGFHVGWDDDHREPA